MITLREVSEFCPYICNSFKCSTSKSQIDRNNRYRVSACFYFEMFAVRSFWSDLIYRDHLLRIRTFSTNEEINKINTLWSDAEC